MFGLIKSATRKTAIKTLTSATEDALESLFSNMEGTDSLLSRLGVDRQQALDAVSGDDEVAACLEDLHSAMQNKAWRIYGEDLSDEDKDRLWKTLKRHLPALAEIVLTARLGGYGVGRYVYQPEPDGFLTIKHISNKSGELAKYVPYRDGSLVYRGSGGEEACNTDVLYLFITHRATSTNPAGEMAAARLYAPVALRKKGFVYAAQFITRYAQPYLIAKIQANSNDDHDSFMSRFYRFVSGGALSIEREDDVMMLQNSADGQAFRRLENLANARIQKTLLGKVKTSDLETASRASQETEENNAYGKPINASKGVWFEFEDEIKVDKTRAERDKMYMDTGQLVLTETYYRDILGFEPEHFELRDPKASSENPASAKFSLRLSDGLARNAPDTAEQAIARPKMEAVLGLLESCKDYTEFEAKLSKLDLSQGDNLLIQRLVSDGLSAWADGADDGRN